MKKISIPSWQELLKELTDKEKELAATAYLRSLYTMDHHQDYKNKAIKSFAQSLNFRPDTLKKLPIEVQASKLTQRMTSYFGHQDWVIYFAEFYLAHRNKIMTEFLDLLSIPHNNGGISRNDLEPIEIEPLVLATRKLKDNFTFSQIKHYFFVAHRVGTKVLENIILALQVIQEEEPDDFSTPGIEPTANSIKSLEIGLLLDDFTTLDRVLIDQIVAMVGAQEGCLDNAEVQDLIETVISLNTTRTRSYYLLGFLDGLQEGRPYQFDRPELNDERKGWYLAGLLVAKTRKQNQAELCSLLDKYSNEFSKTVQRAEGAGVTITNVCLDYLFEIQRFREAMQILKGQLIMNTNAFNLAVRAYFRATHYWRNNQIDSALPILNLLLDRIPGMDVNEEQKISLVNMVYRRQGQCLQSQQHFEQARMIYQRILDRVEDDIAPKLYADLGLIEGGFRNLNRLRLPADLTERESMRSALAQGEMYYRKAIELSSEIAINANYALGLRDYLVWADIEPSPQRRSQALAYIEQALIGIRASSEYAAYEEIGVFGHAQFMRVVLSMDALSPEDSYKLLSYWEAIPSRSGIFPPQDVKKLLLGAELISPHIAAEIADSVWRMRNSAEALSIIDTSLPVILPHSTYLQQELLNEAQDESNPSAQRIEIWMHLVPTLIKMRQNDLAAEGLDSIEQLIQESEKANAFLKWLGKSANFDPVWSQTDADWAQLRIARKLGKEKDFEYLINELFFRHRDENPMAAEQIAHLFEDWEIDPKHTKDLIKSLRMEKIGKSSPDLEERLKAGEAVEILFVGGNEIQAQYDTTIKGLIKKKWPGCKIIFEHTGWSSNWGRIADSLVQKGNKSDAMVIMPMMRTLLGRTLRSKATKPWIPCTRLGRDGILYSIQEAALIGLNNRDKASAV